MMETVTAFVVLSTALAGAALKWLQVWRELKARKVELSTVRRTLGATQDTVYALATAVETTGNKELKQKIQKIADGIGVEDSVLGPAVDVVEEAVKMFSNMKDAGTLDTAMQAVQAARAAREASHE